MCGIAGIRSGDPSLASRERLQRMADAMAHRGPDGAQYFTGQFQEIFAGLAQRQLAITAPSPDNRPPLRYLDRYQVIHNGEIYNYRELRRALEQKGYAFRTQGDTELIAAAYADEGPGCLAQFDGMFAFAIWDEHTGTLFCARDRFGEKPLHYSYDDQSGSFLFASEIKALWAGGIERHLQSGMLLHFLTLGQTTHPHLPQLSFYEQVFRLPPGHYLQLEAGDKVPTIGAYWDLDKQRQELLPDGEAAAAFRDLLEQGLRQRLDSTVPMAITVSGGLDSSTLVAAADHLRGKSTPLRSFSAVFPGFAKDESPFIEALASRYGLNHCAVIPDGDALVSSMETLARCQDEPFSSASVWAQYCVYQEASRQGIRVMIDGQGADEYLGGYGRYLPWFLRDFHRLYGAKKTAAQVRALRARGWQVPWNLAQQWGSRFPVLTQTYLTRKAQREHARHPWIEPGFREAYSGAGFIAKPLVNSLNDILYYDTLQGPLQELLRYADRNAMAHGIETRLPFLHHPLVELVFSLPPTQKIRDGETKWILRESYRTSIPEAILQRPGKTGFEPPQAAWMNIPAAQRAIQDAKQKLVDAGIYRATSLEAPVRATDAYERQAYDWRAWVASAFL